MHCKPAVAVRDFFEMAILSHFWVAHPKQKELSCLAWKVVGVLNQFGTIFLCESGVSTLANITSKCGNRLNIEHDLSNTDPRTDLLGKRCNKSHMAHED